MSINNCKDCPPNCFGNVLPSECIEHDGQSLKTYLNSQLTPTLSNTSPTSRHIGEISSDDIMSKSAVRNASAICSSAIINRTFTYTLSATQTTSTFGWDLLDFIKSLPDGYEVAVVRVRITGDTVKGRNVIADSPKLSSGISVGINQYPATVDVLARITSPCGDIDMEQTINLLSPTNTGIFNLTLNAKDLNPKSGQIILTEQLNGLEAQVSTLGVKVNSLPNSTLQLDQQQQQIDAIDGEISAPGSFSISYTKNGGTSVDILSDIINDLYVQINLLNTTIESQQVEITSLRADVDSLNAL